MCRLLAYLGAPLPLENLILKPEHSLVAQGYQPKELQIALLNADGFGMGWHHPDDRTAEPYVYRNVLPIWNDANLPHLCRYIQARSLVANIRSATPGLPLDFSNCQPFRHGQLLFVHNGWIDKFRQTLYRPMRDLIGDVAYQNIYGLTDSEHIFALITHLLELDPQLELLGALEQALDMIQSLANKHDVRVSGVIVISDGEKLVAARFDNQAQAPSFYLLRQSEGVILASEPLFDGDWESIAQAHSLTVTATDLQPHIHRFNRAF
ncbi:ergothioneine biosynthesis protein EgtC [Leptothoe spongobia]|uniref:Ergothioneine biosynthesis protein EgtC n=1 Tax=Leptothoe spongobia TAU-MAC 1115 TaxID=1967444 RepID=A0A947GGU9_9CYAN|nr:ergothioneine biosynthesis protein EgtC [Leptothoe spongobia]MBT9314308.1 ergothioneine biosynthesis protein EgtC [Leptothoe spongobia TAU-MAC 1115]